MEIGSLVIQICGDLCFSSRNVQKFRSEETGRYWSSWYLRGGCLGCSGVAGNEGCDCNNSLLSCMSFRLESEATGNHLEGNWSDWCQRWGHGMGRYEVVVRVRQLYILAFIISGYYKILYVGDCNIEWVQPRNEGDVGVEAVFLILCAFYIL